jgi:ATP-dependent helicase/nuclease subunit B
VTRPDAGSLEDKLLKEFKMKGLLLEEEVNLRLMDTQIETGSSAIAPFGFKKDGTLLKASSVATRDQFDQLRQYTRRIFEKVGAEIVSGTIQISPYQLKNRMPCTYCSFKPVCHYDPSQPGNEPRVLFPDSEANQWEKIIQHLSNELGESTGHVWDLNKTAGHEQEKEV